MIFDNHYHHYPDTEPESHILHLKATKSAIISHCNYFTNHLENLPRHFWLLNGNI